MADAHAITLLRTNVDRFVDIVGGLDDAAINAQSYDDDWTIAQVCSHLGSGAVVSLDWLNAAVEHREPMPRESMPAIWDDWNSRSPRAQVEGAVAANQTHAAAFEALSDEELAGARINLFGMFDLVGDALAQFRLPELVVHTWDIAVALDPAARVAQDAIELMIDEMPSRVGFFGKPASEPWSLTVRTSDPDRLLVLRTGERISLTPVDTAPDDTDGDLRASAEALVRLFVGRLDDGNADDTQLSSDKVSMDDLRSTFPGI
jgi:uncharacterized protein (TIGR03083 family)